MDIATALPVLKAHHLYRPLDRWGAIDCSCMTHYCPCDHEGFRTAVALLEALEMSDPSAKVAP